MSISENLRAVEEQIDKACRAAGRDRADVRLLPVSKTHPISALREAAEAGHHLFGENRVQELVSKSGQLRSSEDIKFSIIGHLQTNKAKLVAELAAEFQALDSLRLAAELDRRLETIGRELDVLIQVNSSGEPQKSGLSPSEVCEFVDQLEGFTRLNVRGLMTVAVNSPVRGDVIACFERMQDLQQQLRERGSLGSSWDELSMGMSGDMDLAIAHGATTVRVGTAIFGRRDYPTA